MKNIYSQLDHKHGDIKSIQTNIGHTGKREGEVLVKFIAGVFLCFYDCFLFCVCLHSKKRI